MQDRINETKLTQVSTEETLQRTSITARLALIYRRERDKQATVSGVVMPRPHSHRAMLAGSVACFLAREGGCKAGRHKA